MVIVCKNVWPMKPVRSALTEFFPKVKQERLESSVLSLTCDEESWLISWLDSQGIIWEYKS